MNEMTLGEWLDNWYTLYAKPFLKTSTLVSYNGYIEKHALELEDTYYNKYLLPPFNEWLCDNVKPDEHEVAIGDFKRINGLSGELTNLDWFMSFLLGSGSNL